jgi:hypothetical protein
MLKPLLPQLSAVHMVNGMHAKAQPESVGRKAQRGPCRGPCLWAQTMVAKRIPDVEAAISARACSVCVGVHSSMCTSAQGYYCLGKWRHGSSTGPHAPRAGRKEPKPKGGACVEERLQA